LIALIHARKSSWPALSRPSTIIASTKFVDARDKPGHDRTLSVAWPLRRQRLRVVGDALFGQQLLQFARLEHLAHDIAAADEVPLDVKLRNGRPVGIGLDAVAHAHV